MELDLNSPIITLDRVRLAILREKVRDPNVTLRSLSRILKEKYNITLSHTRIAEILKEMKDKGVMREVVMPNENYFIFAFMEISFSNQNFHAWRNAYNYLLSSPNVIMLLATDGDYRWKILSAFRSFQEVTLWLHDFVEGHGSFIQDINLMIVYKILKFNFSPKLFELEQLEQL
jgi:hypothetical protein